MNRKLNVFSAFDGIGTGYQILKELGYDCNYYASEIETDAISVAMKNHPDTIQLGDIEQITKESFNHDIDLVIGGSPCQDLSIQMRDGEGLKGSKSRLFFKFYDLVKDLKPKYFLLENVKMKKVYEDQITELLGVEPLNINSNLVSGQNRNRLYWTNIPNVTIPEDKGILLSDIIEDGYVNRDKSNCLTESSSRACDTPSGVRRYICKNFAQYVFVDKDEYDRIVGKTDKERIEYAKWLWNQDVPNLVEGVDTPKIRMMTPNEVEALQTMPKDYTFVEDLYLTNKGKWSEKMGSRRRRSVLGNGWTKDVVKHLMKNMEF